MDHLSTATAPGNSCILCVSEGTQPSMLILQANALITTANETLQTTDCGPDLIGRATQRLKGTRDRQHKRERILYFLYPSSKTFPRLCRVGALVLKFIYMLLKKTMWVSKQDKFEALNHRMFMDPPWSLVKEQLNSIGLLTNSLAFVNPTGACLMAAFRCRGQMNF